MPDEVKPTQVNVTTDGGLQGLVLRYAQTSIVTFFLILSAWLMYQFVVQGRNERAEDRQLFRDEVNTMRTEFRTAVDAIQKRADERAGEITGGFKVNTEELRNLIAELKGLRRAGVLSPQGASPKASPP